MASARTSSELVVFIGQQNLYLYGLYNHPSLRVNTPWTRRRNLHQVPCSPMLTPRLRSAQQVLNRRPVQYIAPPSGAASRAFDSLLGADYGRIGFSSVLPAAPGMSLWQPRMMPRVSRGPRPDSARRAVWRCRADPPDYGLLGHRC